MVNLLKKVLADYVLCSFSLLPSPLALFLLLACLDLLCKF